MITESVLWGFNAVSLWGDHSFLLALSHSAYDSLHNLLDGAYLLGQDASKIQSIDIMADFQKAFKNFIESGQVWALGIGLVIGWVLHGFIGS
ncbi:MAG: hypothetical protein VKN60_02250 [Cyanobacteriota bacterium]|nr:hypothetical protein [Cyanobacteriota bacterium]